MPVVVLVFLQAENKVNGSASHACSVQTPTRNKEVKCGETCDCFSEEQASVKKSINYDL